MASCYRHSSAKHVQESILPLWFLYRCEEALSSHMLLIGEVSFPSGIAMGTLTERDNQVGFQEVQQKSFFNSYVWCCHVSM